MAGNGMKGRAGKGGLPLCETVRGSGCLVLLSVHEGNYIPASLNDHRGRPLGITDAADLDRHIVIDHGIREVTRLIAASTGAHLFKTTHSRLVADVNRFADESDCVAPEADGTEIPMNRDLDQAGREARLATYLYPVLDALKDFVRMVASENGSEPFVICMHSFARVLAEDARHPKRHDVCVFDYPEFGPMPNVEAFVRVLRNQQPDLVIGHNEPFSARTPGLSTQPGDKRMASPPSFHGVIERHNVQNHFALEICQDLISDKAGQTRMAGAVTRALLSTFDFSGRAPRLRSQTGSSGSDQPWPGAMPRETSVAGEADVP